MASRSLIIGTLNLLNATSGLCGYDGIAYDCSKQLFPRRYFLESQIGVRIRVAACTKVVV